MLRSRTPRRLPPLHALRAFEAAARHLSFKDAAVDLAVTPTAISHQVRLLEDVLGLKLFERHARQIKLTAAGRELYPVLRDSFDAIGHAVGSLGARRLRTIVTLSATVAFTARWLLPRVSAFQKANPRMDLRLHASDDPVDLNSGAVDAAVRYGRGAYPGLKSEELFQDVFGPVCNPALDLRGPEDLARQTLIHFEWRKPRRENAVWTRWKERAGLSELQPKADLIFTDESQAIQAAIAGQGVALVSLPLVADELARGTLVQPFGPTLESFKYFLIYLPTAERSERILALRHWVHNELEPHGAARTVTGSAG
jgi:LysR family glycine cleavage system transcriptional activator